MEKAYLFLRKLVALGLNVLIFFLIFDYIPYYFSIPILSIIFSLIISRITNSIPKELFNYQRSEKYFSLGGLRDLLRMPIILFAFLHDVIVWIAWGPYQILLLITESIYFIKELIFWVLHAIIWFLKILFPFWRIVFQIFIFYLIKWPWWIYQYSFRAIKRSYNWNMLKISIIGGFLALFIFQLFYFLDINLEISGLVYIGVVLSILPISWVFGEIASIRGQKLSFVPYNEVRNKMRNGIESVRGILFFITCFVVVFLIETGLNFLGWIPKTGVILLGLSLNINFVFNIILIFLIFLIVFGSFVLPTYRLYNEFNETSIKDVYTLFVQMVKRSLQYIFGFIPSAFFASLSAIPAVCLVALSFFLTMQIKENTTNIKIEKLIVKQSNTHNQLENYKIGKEINRMKYIAAFPKQIFQEVNNRNLIKEEISQYERQKIQENIDLANFQAQINQELSRLNMLLYAENGRPGMNQFKIEELKRKIAYTEKQYSDFELKTNTEIAMLDLDIEYSTRKYKQAPILFYLSGLFMVVVCSLIAAFILCYYGNFFYRAFLFRNNKEIAKWKELIQKEKTLDKNQPLLSTSLNLLLIIIALIALFNSNILSYFIA